MAADNAELSKEERGRLAEENTAGTFLRAVVRWTTPCSPGLTVDSEGRVMTVESDGGAESAGVLVGDMIIKHNDDYLSCVSATARPSIVQCARTEHVLLLQRLQTSTSVGTTPRQAGTAEATPKQKKDSSSESQPTKKAKLSAPAGKKRKKPEERSADGGQASTPASKRISQAGYRQHDYRQLINSNTGP